jgi:hypothetical protein
MISAFDMKMIAEKKDSLVNGVAKLVFIIDTCHTQVKDEVKYFINIDETDKEKLHMINIFLHKFRLSGFNDHDSITRLEKIKPLLIDIIERLRDMNNNPSLFFQAELSRLAIDYNISSLINLLKSCYTL